jgi:hypothetical protein
MKQKKKSKRYLKLLSIHKPKKKVFYHNENLFGHYLAGLIDGDGHFSTIGQCIICFSSKDVSLARQLRTHIGYGTVKKVKDKKAYNLVISNTTGIVRVANLIRDKLKHPNKIKQFNERLTRIYQIEATLENSKINWETPWFSGFFDADGSMRIFLVKCSRNRIGFEVRLLAQIDQKSPVLLDQINAKFSGFLGYRKSQDTYYYSSTSFGNFFKILKFFDEFSLQSFTKYLCYVYMRKAYIVIQKREHLTESGFAKIQKYHKQISMIKKSKV